MNKQILVYGLAVAVVFGGTAALAQESGGNPQGIPPEGRALHLEVSHKLYFIVQSLCFYFTLLQLPILGFSFGYDPSWLTSEVIAAGFPLKTMISGRRGCPKIRATRFIITSSIHARS